MKNNFITEFHSKSPRFGGADAERTVPAQVDAPRPRPSSARRLANLQALVAEFAARQMGYAAVAEFLHCSTSAARNYINELLDGGIVARHPIDRNLYCPNLDPLVAREFLAVLARSEQGGYGSAATRRVHSLWDDAIVCCSSGQQPARRDPLVAALFGAAGPSAEKGS